MKAYYIAYTHQGERFYLQEVDMTPNKTPWMPLPVLAAWTPQIKQAIPFRTIASAKIVLDKVGLSGSRILEVTYAKPL